MALMFVAFVFGTLQSLSARQFTSTSGKVIDADISFVAGSKVTLRRENGKTVSVALKLFSDEDQKFILDWKEKNKGKVPDYLKNKKPRMGFRVSTGKTLKNDDQFSGYVDEHKQKIHMKVTLENQDTVYPIADAKLTILVLGKSPESGKTAVVYKKQFTGIDLPLSEVKTYESSRFELWYDDKGAMYGHKFKGYIAFLEDPTGKILAEATIPGAAAKYLDAAKKLVAGDVIDKRYNSVYTVTLSKSVRGQGL